MLLEFTRYGGGKVRKMEIPGVEVKAEGNHLALRELSK